MGHYTDVPEDNPLGLTDKNALFEQEALGVARVERYLLEEFDYPVDVTVGVLQDLHRRAFCHLYDWAGLWRTQVPNVGAYLPSPANRVPQLLYEFDELRHRQGLLGLAPTTEYVAGLLAYAHHRLVAIHPFVNGNGRTARLFTNLLAYNYGFQDVVLYRREPGQERTDYLQDIRTTCSPCRCLLPSICTRWRSGGLLVQRFNPGQRHGLVFQRHGGVHRPHDHDFDHGRVLQLRISFAKFHVGETVRRLEGQR